MKIIETTQMRLRALFYRIIKKGPIISVSAKIGKNVKMEGGNAIGANTVISDSEIGYGTYLGDNATLNRCKVGRFCSIAPGVKNISGTHPTFFASSHPAFYSINSPCGLCYVKEQKYNEYRSATDSFGVIIGNDVWLGADSKIIDGTVIGDGAVVMAGAVVTRNVPPYAIVGGVPAKIVKYRFDADVIEELMSFDFWNKDISWIKKNAECFSEVEKLLEILKEEKNQNLKENFGNG